MKVEIVSINDSDKHFSGAIAEYVKRLGGDLTITNMKPSKYGTREQIIVHETQMIIDYLYKKQVPTYLLSKDGKQVTTEDLVVFVQKHDHHLRFVIGGPYGLDEGILQPYLQGSIAFGKITLLHGLAKLLIIEQIYRVQQILSGRSYHY